MKIAVISDIHGNYPALRETVAHLEKWAPDQVIVNGDVVNRGCSNIPCLDLVLQRKAEDGWIVLRGNHEDYVLTCANPDLSTSGPEYEIRRFSEWTARQLGAARLQQLARFPDRHALVAPDGSQMLVMHGTVLGNRVGVYPDTDEPELRERVVPGPAVFVTGHTHRPLTKQVDQTTVVNVGSVGYPFDDIPLSSYGQFEWTEEEGWQHQIVRFETDRLQTEREMQETGFLTDAGALANLVLVELRMARGLIHRWADAYQVDVLQGNVSLAGSVKAFLAEEPYCHYNYPAGTVPAP